MSIARKLMMAAAGEVNPAWDLVYAYYDPDLAWDISSAVYINKSFSVATEELNPDKVFFKPDGTKMYILGQSGDDVNEYNLSTAWDVSSASYLQSFSVAAQDATPYGLFFKPDGTKMYVSGDSNNNVNEYDLSTAWDISTASYLQNFNVTTQNASPSDIFFKPDGTKMYVLGRAGANSVYEYDLNTAWDVSSASYLQSFSVNAQETNPFGMFFKPDGTKMYVIGNSGDDVNEYDLSTAWDVSTASYVKIFSVAGQETNPHGLFFKPDGDGFYMIGLTNDTVYQYELGGFSVAAQETNPTGLFFKPDGTKMYMIGSTGDDVNEYDLSTAWDVSTASYVQNFSVSAQDSIPTGVFFKPDGTSMYVVGNGSDNVYEYSVSTAWNISTAAYVRTLNIGTEELAPQGLFFKPDGTKMYVLGQSGDDVNEYSLSTAWNISTASYVQSFSIATEDSGPVALFFKPDGTKMYMLGSLGDDVNEYDLSTAWDVSTASYVQNFSIAAQEVTPQALFFKDDGTKMFVLGSHRDRVYTYTLGVQP